MKNLLLSVILVSITSLMISCNNSAPKDKNSIDTASKILQPPVEEVKKPITSQTLFFSDGDGKYELTITGTEIKIVYQYLSYEKMDAEYATLSNNKIIVPKKRLAFDGQKNDDVFKIEGNQLCVYNPETDLHDCYEFKRNKSSADLKDFFQ
jgi:hypothetical protein